MQDLKENFEFILPAMKKIYSEVKVRSKKSEFAQWLIWLAACLCSLHFVLSIMTWGVFGLWIPLFKWKEEYSYVDWPMFLHAIPTVVLFSGSILTIIFVRKRNIRMALLTLGFILIVSVSCFFFETTHNLFQAFYPTSVIGDTYSIISIGERYEYWNWWWYKNVVAYSDMFPEATYKYGCIDKTGRIVVEPKFDMVYGFSGNMSKIKLDDKYGYIDRNGAIIVKPDFDNAKNFHEGLAAVEIEGKWGYIDKTSKFVIEPTFDYANNFSEGLASVKIGKKYGYINQKGEFVINCKYDWAHHFKEGLASIEIDDKVGFINTDGEFVIETQFNSARDFSEGLAAVEIDNEYTYIDKTGQIITERQFKEAGDFSEGLAAVRIGGKWGYISKDGNIIIKCQYEKVYPFSGGIALLRRHNGKWGYRSGFIFSVIEQNGEATDLGFSYATGFSEGLAAIANKDGYWGYIDTKGEVVIPCQFDFAYPFSEGIATIRVKIAEEGKND